MKQISLFGNQDEVVQEAKYSNNIEQPIYEPKNKKPHILLLCDKSKTHRLMMEIEKSNVSYDEKMFLLDAARRHTVFNYEEIADYYAHSNKEMQRLMERSGLVIVDFNSAIQNGFVKMCDDIKKQYLEENAK